MEINCAHCLLRPLIPSDAASLAQHANDRDVWLNLRDRFPHPYTLTDAESYIGVVAGRAEQFSFGIVIDGNAVGSISLIPGADIARRTAELGYWLGRPYWGRGVMTNAVGAVTNYAFDVLKLTRVFAVPFGHNTASCRVLERTGYAKEALMRRSAVKAGEVLDQVLYARTDDMPGFVAVAVAHRD